MKKLLKQIGLFAILVLCIQCSEDDANSNETLITVMEYKTNEPVSEARIITYYCSNPDLVFGCLRESVYSSCTTDSRGSCKVEFHEYESEGFKIEKANYWSRSIAIGENRYAIQPLAWVEITFIPQDSYPESSFFYFKVTGEVGFDEATNIRPLDNSIFNLSLFGNEENNVIWILYDNSEGFNKILKRGSFSFSPAKFERLNHTLSY